MKRVKQTVIHLLVIVCLGLFAIWVHKWNGEYLSREELMAAYEYGAHYGPSETLLLDYVDDEGTGLMIGKVDDRTLSIIGIEREFIFWKSRGAYMGAFSIPEDEDLWIGYDATLGLLFGIADVADGTKLTCSIGPHYNGWKALAIIEVTVEEGFFWGKVDEDVREGIVSLYDFAYVWKIVDETGREVYTR